MPESLPNAPLVYSSLGRLLILSPLLFLSLVHPTIAAAASVPWRTFSVHENSANAIAREAWNRIVPACPADGTTRYFLQYDPAIFNNVQDKSELYRWKRLWKFQQVTFSRPLQFIQPSPADKENGIIQSANSLMHAVVFRTRQNFAPLGEPATAYRRIASGIWSDNWTPAYDEASLQLFIQQTVTGWHLRLTIPMSGLDPRMVGNMFQGLANALKFLSGATDDGSFKDELDVDRMAASQFNCDRATRDDPFQYNIQVFSKVSPGQFLCPGVLVTRRVANHTVLEETQSPLKINEVLNESGKKFVVDDNGRPLAQLPDTPPTVTIEGYDPVVLHSRDEVRDTCPSFSPDPVNPNIPPRPTISTANGQAAVLIVQSGFRGSPNPLARLPINLMSDDLSTTLQRAGIQVPTGAEPPEAFRRACRTNTAGCDIKLLRASVAGAASTRTSDGNGNAVLPPVQPGDYYILIYGYDASHRQVYWHEKVTLSPGTNTFTAGEGNAKSLR